MIDYVRTAEQRLNMQVYRGPERRERLQQGGSSTMQAMIDELEHGVLLLSPNAEVMLLNHRARVELDAKHPLQLWGAKLRARAPADGVRLRDALVAAGRGLRRLITLGQDDQRVSLAVVPLMAHPAQPPYASMVSLGKCSLCERLSMQWFARDRGLTTAEARVLDALSLGAAPRDVATMLGVQLTTVRTHVGNLRAKTGARNMRDLLRQVTMLPPMVSALRQVVSAAPALPALHDMRLASAHGPVNLRAA